MQACDAIDRTGAAMAGMGIKIAMALLLAGTFAPAAIMAQEPIRVPDVNIRKHTSGPSHERHPTMRRALAELEHTRAMLRDDAAHDFRGRRKAAIDHINEAIHELREGVESDHD